MSKYSFLDEIDETPLFKSLYETGEGVFNQRAAVYAWSQTKLGQETLSKNGKITGPKLGQWMKDFAKNYPEQASKMGKKGSDALSEKLRNDPVFYNAFCESHRIALLKWNKENPIESKIRVEKAISGLAKWRMENPEEAKAGIKKWSDAGWRAAWEKECWKDNILIAHGAWRAFLLTPDGDAWKKRQSSKMKLQRKDPVFNAKMRKAHDESEAKSISDRANIKLATLATHYKMECPVCGFHCDNTTAERWHFDNCTFDAVKEQKAISKIRYDKIFKNGEELRNFFLKEGFESNYFSKYDIFSKYFKKMHPTRKTSGLVVLKEFNTKAYFKELDKKEKLRKIEIKKKKRKIFIQNGKKADPAKRLKKSKEGSAVKVTCPHCKKEGSKSGMKSWHFDYCKENSNRKIRVREPKVKLLITS